MADLAPVFHELRQILLPYAGKLVTVHDDEDQLYVETKHIQKNKKPLFFAAVQIKKAYVSVHLMPVYVKPELLSSATSELKARMQGKSCFNFKAIEPDLFDELSALVAAGYDSYQQQGFV